MDTSTYWLYAVFLSVCLIARCARLGTAFETRRRGDRQVNAAASGVWLDPTEFRSHFKALSQRVNGNQLVYMDSGATSLVPTPVADALHKFYSKEKANVHRGAHYLSLKATELYEAARDKVAALVNSASRNEIVFTRGATEATNLVANTWGMENIEEGDTIILSVAEHHSNIVPWQLLAQRRNATIKYLKLSTDGRKLDMRGLDEIIRSTDNGPVKLIALTGMSNVLGWGPDISRVAAMAHSSGAKLFVDACQLAPHTPIDVQQLRCDFLVASGHKMLGPTGAGFLYFKYELLKDAPPWMGGGEMIEEVEMTKSTYLPPPARFEAGTPAIGEVIGLGAAIDFTTSLGGVAALETKTRELGRLLLDAFQSDPDLATELEIYGPLDGSRRAPLLAFNSIRFHPSDLSHLLDSEGFALRAGHHCAQPLHKALQQVGDTSLRWSADKAFRAAEGRLCRWAASLRASLHAYNTEEEIHKLVKALKNAVNTLAEISERVEGENLGIDV